MIEFKNQSTMLSNLCDILVEDGTTRSWNFVIPPGFGGETVSFELERLLLDRACCPLVARISADGVESPCDFVKQIREGWARSQDIDCVKWEEPPRKMLSQLLDATPPRPQKVLIISEFHKILGRLDEQTLVALRDAETAGRIQTVAMSIYPHKWIRDLWRKEGQLLHVSKYGDTHKRYDAEPCDLDDLLQSPRICDAQEGLVKMAFQWTGGYPHPFTTVIESWASMRRPQLSPDIQVDLRRIAKESMRRLVEKLDYGEDSRFRDLVLKLHLRQDVDEAIRILGRFHAWSGMLLEGSDLRAECLGDAALDFELELAFDAGTSDEVFFGRLEKSKYYYRIGQYDIAKHILSKGMPDPLPPEARLLNIHTGIMSALYSGSYHSGALDSPNIDSDWRGLLRMLGTAREEIVQCVAPREQVHLKRRYKQLADLARAIAEATRDNPQRPFYALAGLDGTAPDLKTAFALLTLQVENGRSIPGNSSACKAVLDLPEQMISAWALWVLDIKYNDVPHGYEETWRMAREYWPQERGELVIPPEGKAFGSMSVFIYFLYAYCQCHQTEGQSSAPWENLQDVERDIAVFDVRNDLAHAVTCLKTKRRTQFFHLMDRWLDMLEADVKKVALSRTGVQEIIAPL